MTQKKMKNESEKKDTAEIKNPMERINSWLKEAEDRINELKTRQKNIIQSQREKKKRRRKKKILKKHEHSLRELR